MSFDGYLVMIFGRVWEGYFEVEVIAVPGIPWLGFNLGPLGTGTGSNSHLDHSFLVLTESVSVPWSNSWS